MSKVIFEFSDKCLFCGDTWHVKCCSSKLNALLAYKTKIEEYVKHRIRCSQEFFRRTEAKFKKESEVR